MTTKVIAAAGLSALAVALPACGEASGGGGEAAESNRQQAAARFAQCMRRNGVPDFPDPGPNGAFKITPDSQNDAPRAAQERGLRKCGRILAGTTPSAQDRADEAEAERALLAFARCMRERGIDLPDPEGGEGRGVAIPLPDDFDAENPDPRYVRAERECRSHIESVMGGDAR